jgi:dipeptidyl aminopeptidase/acylaminoacyl peptidase
MMLPERAEILTTIRDAGIPLMIVQGDKDNAVRVKYTHQWRDTMEELKMNYKYIEFPGGDHGTVIGDGMPDIFKFFAEHTKGGINKPTAIKVIQ